MTGLGEVVAMEQPDTMPFEHPGSIFKMLNAEGCCVNGLVREGYYLSNDISLQDRS